MQKTFIKISLFFLLLISFYNALKAEFILENYYEFGSNEITAKTLFSNFKGEDFIVLNIPKNSSSYSIKASQIARIFREKGYEVEGEGIISFKKAIKSDLTAVKNFIKTAFLKEYREYNFQILDLSFEQITPNDFNEKDIKSIDFDEKNLRRKNGSFNILVKQKDRDQKIFFKYELSATLDGIFSNKKLSSLSTLTAENTEIRRIPFDKITSLPMKKDELGKVAVKSYTSPNHLITKERLTHARAVQKGDIVIVSFRENGVLAEFSLIAQKSGAIGDIIPASSPSSKKPYRVQITGNNKGILK